MAGLVSAFYTAALAGLALYALHVLVLIVLYFCYRWEPGPTLPVVEEKDLPSVTVQIPLRNEQHVAHRIIRAAADLDWPADRLELQILDDSDDATVWVVDAEVARLRERGVRIEVLRRTAPLGHKAGALAAGTAVSLGDYLAVFDADFYPAPDFLRQTVPYFAADPALGMVQARWAHLNTDYSLMTRIQALVLDAHFSIDHIARGHSRLLTNFNGSAGVWRKTAITDAGGWQADTLTEDLDLSYRAQLHGWRVLYLPEVVVPAELPPLVTAFKAQQERWAKGAFQCFRKLAMPILQSRRLRWYQKVMGLLHLSGYANQPLLLGMILLTVPMVLTNPTFAGTTTWLGTLASIPSLLYVLGQVHFYRDWARRILAYPALVLLWMGLAWSLTLAVFSGLLHWGGAFVRTPKYEIMDRTGDWRRSAYRPRISATWVGELLLGVYVCVAIGYAVHLRHGHLIPLAAGYALGQVMILALTAREARHSKWGTSARNRDDCAQGA